MKNINSLQFHKINFIKETKMAKLSNQNVYKISIYALDEQERNIMTCFFLYATININGYYKYFFLFNLIYNKSYESNLIIQT